MTFTKLVNTVAVATLVLLSPNLLASDVGNTGNVVKSQEAEIYYTPEYFEQAGFKYVKILEQEYYRTGEFWIYNQQLADLVLQNAYSTPEELISLRTEFVRLQNEALSKTASFIGVPVIELTQFWDYFSENRSQFIKEGSPLFINNDFEISAVEKIKVVCNGDHCNNPNHILVTTYVAFALVLNRVPATRSADVRIINDSNVEYAGSSGIWLHAGVGSVKYIGKNCERCNIN